MRRPHVLAHNKGNEYPRDVIVVDTETREEELPDGKRAHRLVFGWAFYTRRVRGHAWEAGSWHRFETRAEFWSWALRKVRSRGRLTIYCHNAEFDAQVLDCFGELARRSWRCMQACLEGPPTMISWRRGTRTVRWLDTLNIWRVPLKVIGEKIGLPKLVMPKGWGDRERADTYCRRDVEIVWRALTSWWNFLRAHDLGTAAPTLASQGMNAFRHRFMRHEIFIDANEAALALSRDAYVGGRCECFRLGVIEEECATVDINSQYPAVMARLHAPRRLLTVRTTATLDDLARYAASYAVVADVELRTDEPAYPHIIDGRLCFPVGRFRQALATPELVYALKRGAIERVHRVAIYERAPLFREFMRWGWRLRAAAQASGDALLDWQAKYLQNGFYGKWGQRGRQWRVIAESPRWLVADQSSFDTESGRWRYVRQIGHAVQELQDDGESSNSFPAIAAHVTSAGRMMLWRLILAAGRSHVWYTDTDSLKGDTTMLRRLSPKIDATRLGALKLERRSPWIWLRGPKDYTEPDVERIKGVRKDALSGDGTAYLQLQWAGWAGSIRRGSLDTPTTEERVKVLSRTYTKGHVGESGIVTPHRLPAGPVQER
jgi:DNA polymerase type B, organellar and viral